MPSGRAILDVTGWVVLVTVFRSSTRNGREFPPPAPENPVASADRFV